MGWLAGVGGSVEADVESQFVAPWLWAADFGLRILNLHLMMYSSIRKALPATALWAHAHVIDISHSLVSHRLLWN